MWLAIVCVALPANSNPTGWLPWSVTMSDPESPPALKGLLVSEVMVSSLRTRETLLYGESENRTFQEIIEAGGTMGWHSFDQSLLVAYESDLITDETAMIFCAHKHKMRRDIDMVKKLRNLSFDEPSGLRMDGETEAKVFSIA